MATLTGSTIATTYKTLMKGGTNNPVVLASDNSDSERVVFGEDDGADVRTDLYLTRNRVGINDATPGTFIGIDCDKGNESFNNYGIYIHGDKGNNTWNSMLALGAATSNSAATQRGLIQSYIADGTTVGPLSINENGGYVGIGVTTPTALLHIDQSSTSGAVPVLKLDQADVDDSFIDFIGTTASDQTKSLSTDTTVGALTGHIKIEINGSPFWLAYYAPN